MTNREKYKQAFSAIHASDDLFLEVEKMERTSKKHRIKTLVASVAACVMVIGSAAAAYVTDLGGIQRTLQLWIYGDQTEVILNFDGNGHYNMEYDDEDGNRVTQGGGGVAIGDDGTETPLTEEDLVAHLAKPEVKYESDGSVWVYWQGQKTEITDKFENGVCYIQLANNEDTLYMTVKYKDGFSTSPKKYLSPSNSN